MQKSNSIPNPGDEDYIKALNHELFKRDRIIYNYDTMIQMLREESQTKDKTIANLRVALSLYKIEDEQIQRRHAFVKSFMKDKYNIDMSVADLDEFITEKKYVAASKKRKKHE